MLGLSNFIFCTKYFVLNMIRFLKNRYSLLKITTENKTLSMLDKKCLLMQAFSSMVTVTVKYAFEFTVA